MTTRQLIRFAPFLLTALFAFVPAAHAAQASFFGPIIPDFCKCPGTAPDWGCVLQTVQNIMNLMVSLSVLVATLVIAYAGGLFVMSPTNPGNREQGRTVLLNAVIGIVIVLASWLIIDTMMKFFYNPSAGNFGPWNSILASNGSDYCIKEIVGSPLAQNGTGLAPAPGTSGTSTNPSAGNAGGGKSTLDIHAAVSYADSHALSSSNGQCALYVRKALAAGGLTSFDSNHPEYASQYGSYLLNSGFTQISVDPSQAQAGDVVVFQPVPGHAAGHIAIYDGSHWVSDFVQSSFYVAQAYQGGSYAIYRP